MHVEALLDRLEGVKAKGPNAWVARCPAHEDRKPSLSIKATDDGRILIHDFAGCPAADVIAAVGLEFSDLFPERIETAKGPSRDRKHRHAAVEALKVLAGETLVLLIAAKALSEGQALNDRDRARLEDAAIKIAAAREVVA